ncbi:MAG: LysE family translocator [Alphaproteobacteria bacterium]|nr:LysE family translocator [Alphaproteobacteria bacterium]
MSVELYLAFVAASVALALMPGPNVAVIVSNAVIYGPRYGLLTVAGTSSAMIPQLAVTTLGLSAVLSFMAEWFEVLRWIGVAYLVYLGVQAWRAPVVDLAGTPPHPKSPRAIYWRGILVSLTNPKTLLFFGAFLPQFVDPKAGAMSQLALLSLTFFIIAAAIDASWALLAGRARGVFTRLGRWTNRVTGTVLLGAGVALALARKP